MDSSIRLQLFKELMLVAIGKAEKLSRTPTDNQWNFLYEMSSMQALVGVCFSALERLPHEQMPKSELLVEWYGTVMSIEQQNELMNNRSSQTLDFFGKAGFEASILKGQGMASLYPNPLRRQSGDIDVWVNSDRESIYRFARNFDKEGKIYGTTYHHIHLHLFDDAEVEVHIYPAYSNNPFVNRRLQKFFIEHSSSFSNGYPDAVFNRIFILFHCYEHLTGHGLGLRQIMDYYYVLLQGFTEMEKNETVKWLKKLKLQRFAAATMWVMQELFCLEPKYMLVEADEKEGEFLLNEILQGGNMGSYDEREWGSQATPFSRFVFNLRRDRHLLPHYPHEVLWQPFFSIWLYFWRLKKGL